MPAWAPRGIGLSEEPQALTRPPVPPLGSRSSLRGETRDANRGQSAPVARGRDTGSPDCGSGGSQRALTVCPALGHRGSEGSIFKGASSSAVADHQSAKPPSQRGLGTCCWVAGEASAGHSAVKCALQPEGEGVGRAWGQEVRAAESRRPGSWPVPE